MDYRIIQSLFPSHTSFQCCFITPCSTIKPVRHGKPVNPSPFPFFLLKLPVFYLSFFICLFIICHTPFIKHLCKKQEVNCAMTVQKRPTLGYLWHRNMVSCWRAFFLTSPSNCNKPQYLQDKKNNGIKSYSRQHIATISVEQNKQLVNKYSLLLIVE